MIRCLAALLSLGLFAQNDVSRVVVLHASVLDKSGQLITSLAADQFKVFEDNVEQQIKVARREDSPVSMVLVIDNSNSMSSRRGMVEAAAIALVRASNPRDEVAIVNFNLDAYLDVPFTNDPKKLEGEGLAEIVSRGGTVMRDAVSLALGYVAQEGKHGQKVLLLITDGNDTASTLSTEEELIEKCRRMSGVSIYTIGIPSSEDRREAAHARHELEQLSNTSGGAAYFPNSVAEVEAIALQIAHEIRNQYVIAYSPANQTLDGAFRTIRVTTPGGKFSVRTRTGYYAPLK